jgi:hypothetical protein
MKKTTSDGESTNYPGEAIEDLCWVDCLRPVCVVCWEFRPGRRH